MKNALIILSLFVVSCSSSPELTQEIESANLEWLSFDSELFDLAREKEKLVLLDVGANWCHWCHVMDDSTYDDPEVVQFLNENFVLAKEDQDSRPDLYAAYRSHGWPATIIFDSDGQELLKLRGYQHRKKFMRKLQAVLNNPVPLSEDKEKMELAGSVDPDKLTERYINSLNTEIGGYSSSKMQLHREGLEFGLKYGHTNEDLANWTEQTFEASLQLVDPVWGGVSQYSDSWVWTNPHYEKLLKVQANYISAYARYGVVKQDPKAIEFAEKVYGYCERFLSSRDALFNNSQNADLEDGVHAGDYYDLNDEKRTAKGIPSVDKHRYLKENAMMAEALIHLWAATSNDDYLDKAVNMVAVLSATNRFDTRFLFMREPNQTDIFSFEDNRWFLRVLLEFYRATGGEVYKESAMELCDEMLSEFSTSGGLMIAHTGEVMTRSEPVLLDNINFCQDLSMLYHLSGDRRYRAAADAIFQNLTVEAKQKVWYLPHTIEAKNRIESEPFHAVWLYVRRDTDIERQFVQRILMDKNTYIIIERKNLSDLNEEDELLYGGMEPNTLFMCTSSYCSAPMQSLSELEQFFEDADQLVF